MPVPPLQNPAAALAVVAVRSVSPRQTPRETRAFPLQLGGRRVIGANCEFAGAAVGTHRPDVCVRPDRCHVSSPWCTHRPTPGPFSGRQKRHPQRSRHHNVKRSNHRHGEKVETRIITFSPVTIRQRCEKRSNQKAARIATRATPVRIRKQTNRKNHEHKHKRMHPFRQRRALYTMCSESYSYGFASFLADAMAG